MFWTYQGLKNVCVGEMCVCVGGGGCTVGGCSACPKCFLIIGWPIHVYHSMSSLCSNKNCLRMLIR